MRMPERLRLDRVFHALADPTRRGIVERLSRGPASVMELAEPHAMALPSILKHLRVLEAGGIVVSRKAGRVRTFRIDPKALAQVERWIAARKSVLNAHFDGLEQYLAEKS